MKTVEREWLGWLTLPLPSTSLSGTGHPMAEMRIVLMTPRLGGAISDDADLWLLKRIRRYCQKRVSTRHMAGLDPLGVVHGLNPFPQPAI